jgi:hypothetical protein
VIKAADAFKDKTIAPNQLWETDFTYLKVIGQGWFYLSTVLDDFSRYIIAWKLCTTMKAEDVTATLDLALQASRLREAGPTQRPRLLSDNGSSYIAGDLAKWLGARNIKHLRGAPYRDDLGCDAKRGEALAEVVNRIELSPIRLRVILSAAPLVPSIGEELDLQKAVLVRDVPLRLKRRGVEMRFVIEGPSASPTNSDPVLLKEIRRAHRCFEALVYQPTVPVISKCKVKLHNMVLTAVRLLLLQTFEAAAGQWVRTEE